MDNNNPFPQRKHPRLKHFDYSRNGMYFITICTFGKRKILSRIDSHNNVILSEIGVEVKKQITALPARYEGIEVTNYVIMPNHIHAVVCISQRPAVIRVDDYTEMPSLCEVVRTIKGLSACACRQKYGVERLFQNSFYEHIIRSRESLSEINNYINTNPARWHNDSFYVE